MATEAGDEDLEAAGVEEVVVAPEVEEEVLHGHDFSVGAAEAAEDFGFAVGKARGFSFRDVFKRLGCGREAVISKGVFVLLRFQSFSHIGFSHQRLDADDEFLDGEWFLEVVVGSQFEAGDNIVRSGFGREEEDRGMVVGLAYAADHLEAVQTGHHHIGNEDVRMDLEESFEAFCSIVCGLHREAFAAKGLTDDLYEGLFVFDEEYLDCRHRFRVSG